MKNFFTKTKLIFFSYCIVFLSSTMIFSMEEESVKEHKKNPLLRSWSCPEFDEGTKQFGWVEDQINELRAYEKETRRELIRYMKLVRSMHEKIESESNKPKNLKKKKKTKKSKKTKKKRKVTKKDEGSKAKKPKKGKKKKVKKKKKHSEKKDEIVLQTKIESTDSFVEFGDVSETEPKPGNLIRKLSYDNSKDILRLLESNPNNKALLDNNPQNE